MGWRSRDKAALGLDGEGDGGSNGIGDTSQKGLAAEGKATIGVLQSGSSSQGSRSTEAKTKAETRDRIDRTPAVEPSSGQPPKHLTGEEHRYSALRANGNQGGLSDVYRYQNAARPRNIVGCRRLAADTLLL